MQRFIQFGLMCLYVYSANAAPYYVGPNGPLHLERTICGSNDLLEMNSQSPELKAMGRPVGRLRAGDLKSFYFLCSGILITKDLFLTARHCRGECGATSVEFGYLTENRSEAFPCKEIVEAGNNDSSQDYMLIRLEGNPGVQWGWYDMEDDALQTDTKLMMIHHPRGLPMRVSLNECLYKEEKNGLLRHRCDTESGSSGSGILIPNFEKPEETRVVGVHAFGGCSSSSSSTNSGPAIHNLAKISPLIRSLSK